MAINILEPVRLTDDIEFTISYEDAKLMQDVRNKLGTIQAIRILRWYNKDCGLRQAKNFIDNLNIAN